MISEIMKNIDLIVDSTGMSIRKMYIATQYYEQRMYEYGGCECIVLVGAGKFGQRLYDMLKLEGMADKVRCFCDNAKERYVGGNVEVEILSVDEAVQRYPEAYYIITPREYENELLQQLTELGISVKNISIFTFAYTGLIDY